MLGIARHSETLEEMVIYQALYGEQNIWVRPKYMFFDAVVCNNIQVNRFKEISKDEMSCLLLQKKRNI